MRNPSKDMIDALPSGMALLDGNNLILETNQAFDILFPKAEKGINIVRSFQEIVDEISHRQILQIIATAKPGYVNIADKSFVVTCWRIPSHKEKLISFRNITPNDESNRLRDATLAMVAHELRTPLAAIRGLAEHALSEPAKAPAHLTRIITKVQYALAMMENLLNRTRLKTGTVVNSLSPIKLEAVFNTVRSTLIFDASEKNLEIDIVVEKDVPNLVELDLVLIQEILTNLVSNAIKNTDHGSVTIRAFIEGDRVGISVKDTGRGIPESKRELIFQEFFQETHSNPATNMRRGTGIGLSIVKGLTSEMGGTLTLHSEEGRGSEFIATFPLVLPNSIRSDGKHES